MTGTPTVPLRWPLPVPDADSAPYWAACQERRLTVQQCTACGQRRFPVVGICHRCWSWDFDWVEVTSGTLYSWIVVRQAVVQSFQTLVPYAVGIVAFDDGVRIPGLLADVAIDALRADLPMRVGWRAVDGGFLLPIFRPEGEATDA